MPMRVAAEDLNDARPEMQQLKAVLLGPHHMAALTYDANDADVDPQAIAQAVTLPDPGALLSLARPDGGPAPGALLRLRRGGGGARGAFEFSARGRGGSRADAMDATFRLAPPLAAGAGGAARVSLESMPLPGRFLAHDGAGGLALQRPWHDPQAATFELRGDLATALAGAPGAAAAHLRPLVGAAAAPAPSLRVVPPAAGGYPKGARVLRGATTSYLLMPMSQIVDEHYAAYLRFVPAPAPAAPAAGAGAALRAGGGGGVAEA